MAGTGCSLKLCACVVVLAIKSWACLNALSTNSRRPLGKGCTRAAGVVALPHTARRNWLLLLHHLCFFAITAVGFFQRSFFVLKVGVYWCWAAHKCLGRDTLRRGMSPLCSSSHPTAGTPCSPLLHTHQPASSPRLTTSSPAAGPDLRLLRHLRGAAVRHAGRPKAGRLAPRGARPAGGGARAVRW